MHRTVSSPRRVAAVLAAAASLALIHSPVAGATAASGQPRVATEIAATTLKAASPTVLGTMALTLGEPSRVQVSGWLTATNSGKKSATVSLHSVEIVGPDIVGPDIVGPDIVGPDLVAVIGPGQAVALPVGIVGPDHDLGTSLTMGVEATSTAPVSIAGGTLSALALPLASDDATLPNASAQYGKELPLGQKATTVLETALTTGDQEVLGQGWVSVRNGGKKAATVTLDYLMDGQLMGSVSGIVGPDRPSSLPVGLLCDGFHPATHTVTVQLRSSAATGVVFTAGSLSAIGLPVDGQMPHAYASLAGGVPLAAKSVPVLHSSLSTSATSDVWMGGWATLSNSGMKPATVTLQSQMGADLEGPAVVVTVPARSTVSVPFGVQCDGEDAGTLSLDLTASSSSTSVTVTDAHLDAWALVVG